MSVETQCQQTHSTNEAFGLSNRQDEPIESAALNLTQIHRKNGRKRSTPQKTINPVDNLNEDGSSDDDTFTRAHSPELATNENSNEETSEKTKSILEHYRSFIQRNTGTIFVSGLQFANAPNFFRIFKQTWLRNQLTLQTIDPFILTFLSMEIVTN